MMQVFSSGMFRFSNGAFTPVKNIIMDLSPQIVRVLMLQNTVQSKSSIAFQL